MRSTVPPWSRLGISTKRSRSESGAAAPRARDPNSVTFGTITPHAAERALANSRPSSSASIRLDSRVTVTRSPDVEPFHQTTTTFRPASRAADACARSAVTYASGEPNSLLTKTAVATWMASRVRSPAVRTTSSARARTGSLTAASRQCVRSSEKRFQVAFRRPGSRDQSAERAHQWAPAPRTPDESLR